MFSPRLQVLMERFWGHVTQRAFPHRQRERSSSEDEKTAAEASEVRVVHFSDHIILFRPDVRAGG